MAQKPKTKKPRGEEEVRKALIEAAVETYIGGGVFSVRSIAARAGINHGQIHHYFGGKEGLKQAMLDHLAQEQYKLLTALDQTNTDMMIRGVINALSKDPRFVRALAKRLLEVTEEGAEGIQGEFPVMTGLKQTMAREGRKHIEFSLAECAARALGWRLFSPWIIQAVGLDALAIRTVEEHLTQLFPLDAVKTPLPLGSFDLHPPKN